MKTKQELRDDIKGLRREISNERYDSAKKLDEVQKECKDLKYNVESLTRDTNKKSEILNLVVDILAGEASQVSKTEVLIDMFPEVKELTEYRKKRIPDYNMGRRF